VRSWDTLRLWGWAAVVCFTAGSGSFLKVEVSQAVVLCSLAHIYPRFRDACCLHHQADDGCSKYLWNNFYKTTLQCRRQNLKSYSTISLHGHIKITHTPIQDMLYSLSPGIKRLLLEAHNVSMPTICLHEWNFTYHIAIQSRHWSWHHVMWRHQWVEKWSIW
jgi:hypothetical protein